jgi:uncharacterized protein (TIGR02147 family)
MTSPPSTFTFTDYRAYLRAWSDFKRSERGTVSRLCASAGIHNAHFSRVLKEQVHLTMDQAFRVSRSMGLGRAEARYFLKLVEKDRAGDPDYRKQLTEELGAIKRAQENFGKRHRLEPLGDSKKEMLYYSSWHWVALHYIVGIGKYDTAAKIAARLGLDKEFVRRSLETLQEFGLVGREGDRWTLSTGSIHLPKTSPMNPVQHGNWRTRAVSKSQDLSSDGLHYTTVQAVGENTYEELKQRFLEVIDEYRKAADPSPSEELICFSLDFFRV